MVGGPEALHESDFNVESSGSANVSLFTGGLLPRLLRRAGLREEALTRVRAASTLFVPAIAWLPLLVLTAVSGTLLPATTAGTPFLLDAGVHVRLLAVMPLLILGGLVVQRRMQPVLEQFVERGLVRDGDVDKFRGVCDSTLRLGDSILVDVAWLVLIYAITTTVFWRTHASPDLSWYGSSSPAGPVASAAGIWFTFVSLPIFQFLLLRWYYRLALWSWFLNRVAKLDLHLIPTHPDRLGGLGFLVLATQALLLFAMAHGALLAGWLSNRIFLDHQTLLDFKDEIWLVLTFVLCITMLPLLAFARPLVVAKRRGTFEYGVLASRYAREFDEKWVHAQAEPGEPLVGSADIQSMADMGGTYDLVAAMRVAPITLQNLIAFAGATLLPVAPLLLTVMPFEELLKKLAGILM